MKIPTPIQNFLGLLRYAVLFQILYFLTIPIVLIYYNASSYGLFSLAFAVSSVLGSIAPLRLERALVVEPKTLSGSIIRNCVASSIVVSLAVFFIVSTTLESIETPQKLAQEISLISSLYCLILASVQVLTHIAIRQEKVMLTGRSDLIYGVGLVLGLLSQRDSGGTSAATIFLIFLISRVISLLPYVYLNLNECINPRSARRATFRVLRNYYIPVLTAFLSNIQFRGMFYLVSLYFGNSMTGNLAMTHRIMFSPVNLLGSSLRRAFFLEFTKSQHSNSAIHSYIEIVWRYGTIGTIIIFPLFLTASHYGGSYLPDEWIYIPVLGLAIYPAISIVVLLSWLDRLYDAYSKQKYALKYEIIYTVILYFFLLLTLLTEQSIATLLLVYSLITTAYNLAWAYVSLDLVDMPKRILLKVGATHSIILMITAVYMYSTGKLA